MALYLTLSQESPKLVLIHFGKFSCFAKREDVLGVERDRQFSPQLLLNTRFWQTQGLHNGVRN